MIEGIGEIDVVDLLKELDVSNVHEVGRDEVGFSCVFSNGHAFGDANPSAHMNKHSPHPFRCKGCGATGTAFSLVGSVLRLSPVETLRWLRDRYGDGYREPKGGRIAIEMADWNQRRLERQAHAESKRSVSLIDEEATVGERGIFYMDWASDHPAAEYMRGRGFHPDYLSEWQAGFDSWTNRVTIPIRDDKGCLVGFKGRAILDAATPKYLILGDSVDRRLRYGYGYGFEMHDTRQVIFGLHDAHRQQGADGHGKLIVCEGELNAWALRQAAGLPSVAIGMTSITEEQIRLLRWYAKTIVIFYDTDPAGFAATWGYYDEKDRWHPGLVEKLSLYLRILVVPDHEGDPASLLPSESIDLVEQARPWVSIAVS